MNMTNKEARRIMLNLSHEIMDQLTFDELMAINTMYEANQKQIPIKPTGHKCPSCYRKLVFRNNYCPHCSQALDWRVVNKWNLR